VKRPVKRTGRERRTVGWVEKPENGAPDLNRLGSRCAKGKKTNEAGLMVFTPAAIVFGASRGGVF